ncbi:MAG: hypothetical protein LAP85_17320 [Acidobacteriia bacterium]|nr:hypothetical protein [Terriglobia bacterium]
MQGESECDGKIKLGSVPEKVCQRLAGFQGNWLEFIPEESAIIVRHVQPGGCPAISGVPCELISMIDSIPAEQRQAMPGGEFFLRDSEGQMLRLIVERGDIRIQWPCLDYSRAVAVPTESIRNDLNPRTARVRGWANFLGAPDSAGRLQAFVDAFEGLYPEGSMPASLRQDGFHVEFQDVNVGPSELLSKLLELADPAESLDAQLEVSSFVPGASDENFRILVCRGRAQALRPSLWR